MDEEQLIAGFASRMSRVRKSNGFFTDAGLSVLPQRSRVAPESHLFPCICVVLVEAEFVQTSVSPAAWDQVSEVHFIGVIDRDSEDESLPVKLLRDMKSAALQLLPPAYALLAGVDALAVAGESGELSLAVAAGDAREQPMASVTVEPRAAAIYPSEEGNRFTEIHFVVTARWCDSSLEQDA